MAFGAGVLLGILAAPVGEAIVKSAGDRVITKTADNRYDIYHDDGNRFLQAGDHIDEYHERFDFGGVRAALTASHTGN